MLSKRQSQILKIIVEQYIKTALPVGSKTLLENNNVNYSSATVRNECVELETLGLLEKTHSSSGRIPSTKGYRYYVDNLMNSGEDHTLVELKRKIAEVFENRNLVITEVLNKTSNILSEMTNLISVVIGPNLNEDTLKKIELVPISNDNALAICITSNGHVQDKIFNIQETPLTDLTIAIDIFNTRLIGTKINEISEKVNLLKPILEQQVQKSEFIIQGFINTLINFSRPLSTTHGVQYMLENPEFNDINKIKTIIRFIESQSPWMYFDQLNNTTVQIKIGEELGNENNDMAMIMTTFKVHDGEQGQIAIVGPKRLEYEKLAEILNWINQTLMKNFK
ncbi:heat-inducible transcriptional repressor HrcA [Spiroplasma sp. AdecLV25b]|uniref:heat-inducible transcriptional repressor HrcA n=1 Tax=Spiroplasma sp. AdecLV25b TaxID=3027162 RepID=UPI0027E036C0|nr:heat-inducible transcriptional repressor HrcA [Spiroplasma sp. AdecLV25b]